MKIKSDFITNSSSSSYLVYIPDGVDIHDHLNLSETMRHFEKRESSEDLAKIKIEIKDAFYDLVNYGTTDFYEYQNGCYVVQEILDELDLSIHEWDGPPDAGQIINLAHKPFIDHLNMIRKGGWGIKYGGWGKADENKK